MTQRKNVDIGPVIMMMRNAYRLVKIAPFIYAMIYMMCLFGYLMFNDTVSAMIDVLCYISPVPVIYNLLLSRAFHLCVWHRSDMLPSAVPLAAFHSERIAECIECFSVTAHELYVIKAGSYAL